MTSTPCRQGVDVKCWALRENDDAPYQATEAEANELAYEVAKITVETVGAEAGYSPSPKDYGM